MRRHGHVLESSDAGRPWTRRVKVGRDPDQVSLAGAAARSGKVLGTASLLHLQRQAGNAAVASLVGEEEHPSPVTAVVGQGGQALDAGLRAQMEQAMGHDFSGVRVHTDSKAAESARSVGAQAYTSGRDIVFASGSYSPGTTAGRHTLAHELTHVVQQRAGAVEATPAGGGIAVSHPSDRFERAAEANATRLMSDDAFAGQEAGQDQGGAAGAGQLTIQRQEAEEEEGEEG